MDIRKKTVVIVCITLLCLILALYISSEVIVLGGFSRVETQNAQKETNRVLVALGNDINALDAVTYDWASRGDTIAFVTANISGTEWSRLDTDTFERLGFNEILLYNASGSLVSGQAYDLNRHTLVPVPPDLHSPPSVYPHLKFQNGSSYRHHGDCRFSRWPDDDCDPPGLCRPRKPARDRICPHGSLY